MTTTISATMAGIIAKIKISKAENKGLPIGCVEDSSDRNPNASVNE
jgi:hypothetical protein